MKWISNILLGADFGLSFEWQQPVGDLIWERMALTLVLTFSALLMTWGIALPVGVFSAVKKYSIADYLVTGLSFLGLDVDPERNRTGRGDRAITSSESRAAAFVIRTQEELVIARETLEACKQAVAVG